MQPTILVIIPPVLVLFLAFYTRKILLSLFVGIVSGLFIASDFSIIKTLQLTVQAFIAKATDIENLYTFGFLLALGITLVIITRTGGAVALGTLITKKLRHQKDAQSASLILSTLLAIDDYLNCLTVGYVMHPITDKFNIPRVKLSFLVNSMTAPLTIIIPFSSWAGMIIRQFMESGISTEQTEKPLVYADPLFTYLKTIPFIFYSLLMIIATWFIVRNGISFGLIKQHEDIADTTQNLFGGKDILAKKEHTHLTKTSILDFFVPMITLLGGFMVGVLYTGNYYLFGGNNGMYDALKNSTIIPVLFAVGLITLIVSIVFSVIRKKILLKELPALCKEGIDLMLPAILLIFFAWTFSTVLRENLQTGSYLASVLLKNISAAMLPGILFLATATVSIIIGSSWGTIALMLPIAVEIVVKFSGAAVPASLYDVCLLIPCLGAVLSGAVAGNHLSPIADVSIMSSTSTGAHHIEHVKGQFMYALPVFIATALAFFLSGFLGCISPFIIFAICMVTGIIVSLGLLYIIDKIANKGHLRKAKK